MQRASGEALLLEELDLLPEKGMEMGKWPYTKQVRGVALGAWR